MAERIGAIEAATHFLTSLEPERAREERQDVEDLVTWFGRDRAIQDLTGNDVDAFVAELEQRHPDLHEDETQLEPLRGFLAYCSRMNFTAENLVPSLHLRAGGGGGARGGAGAVDELGGKAYYVTLDGLALLEGEVEELKGRRPQIADELRAAMADKDFRENAPLDAARDTQAHLEARIRSIEDQLRHAVIIDPDEKAGRANVGSTVRVLNMNADREQTFHLVSPGEVDAATGKISVESPFGEAVINHAPGDEVTVTAPGGQIRLRLIEVIG